MPNIHTLSDIESTHSDDNMAAPFLPSNASFSQYSGTSSLSSSAPPEDSFWSLNVPPQNYNSLHLLLTIIGCPCFIGPPLSKTRIKDYMRLLVTFLFYISIIDVIVFALELVLCGVRWRLWVIPAPKDMTMLVSMGAKLAPLVQKGQVYRLIAPIFLHAGVLHLLFNLMVQLTFGLGFERHWGIHRIVPIYLIGGIAGNLLSCVTSPNAISVGASGALLALFGAKFANVICRFHSLKPEERVMSIFSLVFILFFSSMFSFSESVDLGAHLGGFIMGFLLGMVVFANYLKSKVWRVASVLGGLIGVFVFFTLFGLLVGFGIGWR